MAGSEDASITFKTTKEFKAQIEELSELETRKTSQTIKHYLIPIVQQRLKELKAEKGE